MSLDGRTSSTRSDNSGKIGKPGPDKLNAILDRLDAADDSGHRNKRSSTRCTFRRTDVPIRVHHPGGTSTTRTVATRNLSANGIGFLYPGFVHVGTRCELTLKRRLGGSDTVQGKVVFCGHIGGTFHQIGVRFDDKIFPKLYLDPGSYEDVETEAPADRSKLTGRVLYLDDQEMDRMLVQHYLRDTQIELVTVGLLKEAVEEQARKAFDLLLIDLNLTDCPGEMAIKELRDKGHQGPILLVTAETSPQRLAAAQKAGAVAVITKPYEATRLYGLIANWLGGGSAGTDAIFSSLPNASDMKAMLEKYVATVRSLAVEIQRSFEADEYERCRAICIGIKGSGSGYGFPQLSEAAKEAVKSLDATMSAQESAVQIQRLLDLCRRVAIQ